MCAMPSTNRETTGADTSHVTLLRKWLWNWAQCGWDPVTGRIDNDPDHWTHEDNQAAAALGWMLLHAPGANESLDLFVVRPNLSAAGVMDTLKRLAPIDPLAAKALTLLVKQKMRNPDRKFNFE